VQQEARVIEPAVSARAAYRAGSYAYSSVLFQAGGTNSWDQHRTSNSSFSGNGTINSNGTDTANDTKTFSAGRSSGLGTYAGNGTTVYGYNGSDNVQYDASGNGGYSWVERMARRFGVESTLRPRGRPKKEAENGS
jgi:hypothetical protein